MKVLLSQIIIPYSKLEFFKILSTKLKGSLIIFAGEDTFEEGIKSAGREIDEVIVSRNKFYFNKSFYRTKGFLKYYFSHNMVICTFTMRSIDMYSILFLNFFFNKKLIFWGHIDGKNKRLDPIRYYIARMADHFICYSKSDAKRLNSLVPKLNKNITYLGNSIVTKKYCETIKSNLIKYSRSRKDLIYSGRVSGSKKILNFVKLFLEMKIKSTNIFENLIIIGDGDQLDDLRKLCHSSPSGESIKILGFVHDEDQIEKLYSTAAYSISPGYVGLSCIQSFAHGVPMIISRNENHSPEIESCTIENSQFYNSVEELENLIQDKKLMAPSKWNRSSIIKNVIDNYTIDKMVEQFHDSIHRFL